MGVDEVACDVVEVGGEVGGAVGGGKLEVNNADCT